MYIYAYMHMCVCVCVCVCVCECVCMCVCIYTYTYLRDTTMKPYGIHKTYYYEPYGIPLLFLRCYMTLRDGLKLLVYEALSY